MSVEVKLELGHKAVLRDKASDEGYTHNWTVFVKGVENSNIYHFVDKVVFHLHESFPKPKRVVKEPPYQVSESGYAGFMMPIEVYFRSREEPKKVRFEYDLFLQLEGSPVHNIRVEKLTFQNPSEDFRRKLLKARSALSLSSSSGLGGSASVGSSGLPTLAVAPLQHSEEPQRPTAHVKPVPAIPEKKPRAHTPSKESAKPSLPPPKPSQPLNDLFGSPIKGTKSHSPEQTAKSKEASQSNQQKQNKPQQSAASAAVISNKDNKPTVAKESRPDETKDAKAKAPKAEKDVKKTSSKRPSSSSDEQHNSVEKKRKHGSTSGSNGKVADVSKTREDKDKKEKYKAKPSDPKKEKPKISTPHKEHQKSPKSNHKTLDSLNNSNSNDAKAYKTDGNLSDPHSGSGDDMYDMSPVPRHMDSNFISPLSSNEDSPQPLNKPLQNIDNHVFQEESPKKQEATKFKSETKSKKMPKKQSRHNNESKAVVWELSPSEQQQIPEPTCHHELVDLQKRIMAVNDRQQLQKIVDVIEKTGKYLVTNSSFDFDLCILDPATVRLLKNCLS